MGRFCGSYMIPVQGELLPWKGVYWRVAQVKREGEKTLVLLESRGETGGALKRRLAVGRKKHDKHEIQP